MPARILVVDDDPLIGELICEIPRSAGVDASFLTSSTEAAGRLKGEKYDDVFLLQEIEEFVQKRLQDIRGLLFADVPRAKAELSKHCTAITLTPEGSTFRIAGDWNLLGGRSDGAGGQNRTGYARLFRAALYQ